MQLTLIKKNAIEHFVLPEKIKGQYWITHKNSSEIEERVISIEAIDGKWLLKSNRNCVLQDGNNQNIKETDIEAHKFYNVSLKSSNEKALVYTEPITDDRRCFKKFILPVQGKLTIGRGKDCDICYSNNFASSKHAEIIIADKEAIIKDLSSSNGTFVNGLRVANKVLVPGDMIYVMGLKIIYSKDFIAINNPDGQVSCNRAVLKMFTNKQPEHFESEEQVDDESSEKDLFYRSPRFKKDIEKTEIKIDPPPSMGNNEETPLMLILGPSITMGMTSLLTGLLTIQNVMGTNGDLMSAMPTLVMTFSMLAGTILWPVLTKGYEKKKRTEWENLRQVKYVNYLESIRKKIAEECLNQKEILNENHVTADECADRIKNRKRNLWERTIGQNDFLKVRLGIGSLPIDAEFKYPEKKFTIEDDNLSEELYKLVEEPKVLEQVPVTLSFVDKHISGIIGSRNNVIDLMKNIIIQLTALHSYDELKFVFIYDKKEQKTWEFAKWLPHSWDNGKSVRFIASNQNDVKELSAFFEGEIKRRESLTDEDEIKNISPYYIVFAASKALAAKAEMINLLLKHKKNYGFSLVTLYDELKNLPRECSIVVELNDGISKMYDKNDITGNHTDFKPDNHFNSNIKDLAVNLANIQLDTASQVYTLPNMLTFLEMFGVGKIEHLNVLTRWKENDPTKTLETPIGVDTSGELFKLDLHEKYHGPHGLIAGMTGSGKSEFIMAFILSLALNYHPDEVAFVLIDYKGGGMANTFEDLPHLAGTITNLDGAAVKRSLVSIQSELKRRQAIFSETSKKVNVSNIDIYKYQKLYRDGVVEEPLQHLFIISDEFAELKTQQPEFMEQLVSAARIGRSLGVHLILATQKPSGVVDDQIWSNSKFRICLKVQEKADSMDVIKRPDAAEISTTGRFFVQVGFNEVFELGQSAWGGAPYYPTDRVEKNRDESVEVIDNLGRIIKQAKKDKYAAYAKNPPKQIDETIKYLSQLAKDEDIKVKPLWLEPIPELIYTDELRTKYNVQKAAKCIINPVIGEIDDPANQRQIVMTLPVTKEGNTIIYGAAGSGKTTFLTTLIYSMMKDHTPAELNFYILDFGSETLRSFAKAPHVGDVLLAHESEKTQNLFKLLNNEIEKRKKLFADYGGDYQSYIKTSGKNMESIVVIIHNYSAFAEIYEGLEESISYLTREGVKYGIYFIVTALNTNAIRFRLLQNFKQLLVLQLNDLQDYSGVLGNVGGVYPSKYKGRGIFKSDDIYEFQTAHISKKAVNTLEFIKCYCIEYSKKWGSAYAKKIPILPEKIDAQYLADEIKFTSGNKIPVGIEKNSLNISYYDFDKSTINVVLSQNKNQVYFIQGLAEVIAAKENSEVLVIDSEGMFEVEEALKYEYVDSELDIIISRLFNIMLHRNNSYKDAEEQGETLPTFDRMTCIINSLSGLMGRISEDSKDKLRLVLEKGELDYNVNFIIADSISGISMVAYDNWFIDRVSLSDAIWIGNGITDQYQWKISNVTNDMYQEIGDDFGYVINKGKVSFIKLLSSSSDNEEVELVG